MLATEIQPWNSASPQDETESPKQEIPLPAIGRAYVPVDENVQIAPAAAFTIDPSLIERGWRGHCVVQNKLASHVRLLGAAPLEPDSKPVYDLAWELDGKIFVAEIKSVTDANEEGQLRLGLGQVLRYAHQLSKKHGGAKVIPVLVPEREPSDPEWAVLCKTLGVILTWPDDFASALRSGQQKNEGDTI